MDKKKKIFLITGISFLVLIAIVGGTYAWYIWTTSDSEVTNITAGVGAATVNFDGGSDISANLRPVSDKSKGIVKNINVKADTTGLVFNMYLDITSIDTGLKDESFRYELYKGTTKVKEGNFSDSYLTSNTVTCTKNNTNHIVLLTNESISTSKTSYTLYIWIDGANYTNPNTMMNKTFSFKLHADGEGAVLAKTAAQTITELYMNASKTPATNNGITYNYANIYDTDSDDNTSGGLMNDRLGGTTTDLDGGNIRYYGASPNNYIYFNCESYPDTNCELWRIIGVFDGKLKLIRGSQIEKYSWDNKDTSTGAENYGKNDWTTARLMKLLNPSNYYTVDSNDNNLGQSLYYNSASGKCYSGSGNATVDCDFTSTGIKNNTTRNMIAETTYNLGGWASSSIYPNLIYEKERGTTVYTGNHTTWTGKIALAYPSDYGYAVDLNQCNQALNKYNDSTCTSNNWMKSIITNNGSNNGWFLTPISSYSRYAWFVHSGGYVYHFNAAYLAYGVAPVLSLSSELGIESGDGSSSNPYKLFV